MRISSGELLFVKEGSLNAKKWKEKSKAVDKKNHHYERLKS